MPSRSTTQAFMEAAKNSNVSALMRFVEGDEVNINIQDEDGMGALHHVAASNARPCLRVLVNSGKCDYLLQDNKGRYASELAFEFGKDYAVGRLLAKKEAEQAAKERIDVWPKLG